MAARPGHAAGSEIPRINRAWRRITLAVIVTAATYKIYRSYTRLEGPQIQAPPGSFTGASGVEQVERKSKYEGAGNSALGRRRGDKFN